MDHWNKAQFVLVWVGDLSLGNKGEKEMKILGLFVLLGGLTTVGLFLSWLDGLPEKPTGNPARIQATKIPVRGAPSPLNGNVTRKKIESLPEETPAHSSAKAGTRVSSGGGGAAPASTTGPPEVELRYRFESGGLDLPLHWLALDHFVWDGDPIHLEDGKVRYPNGRMVSHDTIGLSISELQKVLSRFPPLKNPKTRTLPSDDRFLFHVEARTGIADFLLASVLFQDPEREYGVANVIQGNHPEPLTGIPRGTVPPDRKLWIFSRVHEDPLDFSDDDLLKFGLGFGGIRGAGGGFFAPRRTDGDEIDPSTAWLCAARDPATGDWWLWFEE